MSGRFPSGSLSLRSDTASRERYLHECLQSIEPMVISWLLHHYPFMEPPASDRIVASTRRNTSWERICQARHQRGRPSRPTAQHLVQGNEIAQTGQTEADQGLLGSVERPLGNEDAQVAVDSSFVASLRKTVSFLQGIHQGLLGILLFHQPGPQGERVADFPEGRLDRLLVVGDGDIPIHLGSLEIGFPSAGMSKMGHTTCGAKFHVPGLPSNKSWSSLLMRPPPPVRVICGKYAARAAPMLAYAAFNWCSAVRMSGRRSSTSEGNPGAISFSARSEPSSPGSRAGRNRCSD